MHFTLPRHYLLIGLLGFATLTTSCVGNLATKFGKQPVQVTSNVSDFAVVINAGQPITVAGKSGMVEVKGANSQQLTCFKKGYQDEPFTLLPDKKNKFRYIDLGAGVVLLSSGIAVLNTGGGALSTVLGGAATVYGAAHLLNAAIPSGTFGAYGKYNHPFITVKLYPDSMANPKKAIIGCSSFKLNTPQHKVIGNLSSLGKFKGIIRFTDSLLIDSLRMVENVNQHLVKLKLANKWTRLKKTNNSDATFSEEPTHFITASVIELTQNGMKGFSDEALIYKATITIEWTLRSKDGKVLMKKITNGEGSRKEELFSNFNRSQELTAMDDAVRRAFNELLFSAQFIETIKE